MEFMGYSATHHGGRGVMVDGDQLAGGEVEAGRREHASVASSCAQPHSE